MESTENLEYWRAYILDLPPRLVSTGSYDIPASAPLESADNINYWRAYLAKI